MKSSDNIGEVKALKMTYTETITSEIIKILFAEEFVKELDNFLLELQKLACFYIFL